MEKMERKVKLRIPSKAGYIEMEVYPEQVPQMLEIIKKQEPRKSKSKVSSIKKLILDLIDEGFFEEPRRLREIREKLKLRGYSYEVTTLSPILHRDFLKEGILDRIGTLGSYKYVISKKILQHTGTA